MEIVKLNARFFVEPKSNVSFWENLNQDKWEEETFTIFDRFITSDSNYMDIGAWIGPTVLYGANKANHVFSFEPDPTAYAELNENIGLNPHLNQKITAINAAITPERGTLKLYVRTSSGDSMSSMLPTGKSKKYHEVPGIPFEDAIRENDIKNVNFIKMDVEASEYFIIPSMQLYLFKNRPTLYLSVHRSFIFDQILRHFPSDPVSKFAGKSVAYLRAAYLTNRLIKSLNFYKYVYDADGRQINPSDIHKAKGIGSFVFTDEKW